jgi:hypothetical protein
VEGGKVGERAVFRDLFLVRIGESVRVDEEPPRLRSGNGAGSGLRNGQLAVRKVEEMRRRQYAEMEIEKAEEELGTYEYVY